MATTKKSSSKSGRATTRKGESPQFTPLAVMLATIFTALSVVFAVMAYLQYGM